MQGINRTKYKISLLASIILITLISLIDPLYPDQQHLQHSATIAAVIFLLYDIRKNLLSAGGFTAFGIFILLHVLGARWIYSYVPYNHWSIYLTGFDLNAHFGSSRNHYDRFVHFAFGLLILPPIFDIYKRKIPSTFTALLLSWLSIQTFSLVYELFEWALSLLMSPGDAESYNGQQGDMWDAHKDMALALLGSTLTAAWYLLRNRGRKPGS
jgi:putative membrane protein